MERPGSAACDSGRPIAGFISWSEMMEQVLTLRPPRPATALASISMEERIELVDGVLSIKSQPQQGTNIYARVPVAQDEAEDVS